MIRLSVEATRAIRYRWVTQDRWGRHCGEDRVPAGRDHEVLEGLRHARTDISGLLDEVDRLRAENRQMRAENGLIQARHTRVLGELRDRATAVETALARVEAADRRVSMVEVWTNEDGRRFVFADDLHAALHPEPQQAGGRS